MMDTVLIVDDNPFICDMLAEFCELIERPALTATDGFEAVQVFREHQHEIGLVVLDMTLPGLSGVQVFWALRQINPTLKVILSSGSSRLVAEKMFPNDTLTEFLPKPYTMEKLTAVFKKFA